MKFYFVYIISSMHEQSVNFMHQFELDRFQWLFWLPIWCWCWCFEKWKKYVSQHLDLEAIHFNAYSTWILFTNYIRFCAALFLATVEIFSFYVYFIPHPTQNSWYFSLEFFQVHFRCYNSDLGVYNSFSYPVHIFIFDSTCTIQPWTPSLEQHRLLFFFIDVTVAANDSLTATSLALAL